MAIGMELNNVYVDIPLFGAHDFNFKKRMLNAAARRDTSITTIRALDNITLNISEGARVGLIGENGSGKTTLLRVLARTLVPTSGTAVTTGRVAAMLDGMLGIDPEATGYENIMIRGLVLGLSRAEIERKKPEIAEFSGLGDRLNHSVHTYSSGMCARLTFSITTSVEPEILLIDEGIGTADVGFTARASERLREFMGRAGILVLASHSEVLLEQFCDTAIWFEKGHAIAHGPAQEMVRQMNVAAGVTSTPA